MATGSGACTAVIKSLERLEASLKMKCPECGVWTVVKEARESKIYGYKRRRECANGHRFTTHEVVIPDEIIKDEQRRRLQAGHEQMVAVRQSRRKTTRTT